MALSAPTSEVDICNLSQIKLKGAQVVQIDPPTTEIEQLYANLYQQIRRTTLRMHVWNFASKRIIINPISTAPLFEFTHAYNLPNDFIRFKAVTSNDGRVRFQPREYAIEDSQILLNAADNTGIKVKYVYDNPVIVQWDPLAIQLLVINLAIEIGAKQSSQSNSTINRLIKEREDILAQATAIDGQEHPPVRVQRSRFIEARRVGGRVAGPVTDTGF